MVGEPPRRRDLGHVRVRDTALRPGVFVAFDRHGRRFTTANDLGYILRLVDSLHGHVGICCPRCDLTSHNRHDVDNGYCGHCHWWTSDPAGMLNTPESIAQAEADGAIKAL